ncbi:TIGR02117 family protein [Fulvimarina sp. 2208YS6-2-32]|uniref:TIGR02117 family protein n=1 Tax=Fulvimarina uroteuthidis TaxID=3098149 RepID=UPI002AC8B316|nr:TIGR02117 family protein [Fulvimarina sp. 2208YS6-2-32]
MRAIFRRTAIGVAFVVLVLALGTLIPRGEAGGDADVGAGSGAQRTILVLSNAIHTDIALPLNAETRAAFGFVASAGLPIERPDAEWLVLGWGGETFYVRTPTWSDLEVMPVVQSVLGDRSVMHVELAGRIDPAAPHVTPLVLSPERYADLVDAIMASFEDDPSGAPALLPVPGYGAFDRFYEARGGFQVLFGCNTWTGQMLREAGIATGLWTPLPFLLGASLAIHN